MFGPGAVQLTLTSPSLVQTWMNKVDVRGYGAAYDGTLAPPQAWCKRAKRGPFDDEDLPSSTARALGARALLVAIGQAIQHPAVDRLPGASRRAIVVGSQTAAIRETVEFLNQVEEVGAHLVNPGLFPSTVMNAASGLAAIHHDCQGPNITLNNGSTSALDAIAVGADLILSRQADLVFAGGFEGLDARSARWMGRPTEPFSCAVIVALSHADHRSAEHHGSEHHGSEHHGSEYPHLGQITSFSKIQGDQSFGDEETPGIQKQNKSRTFDVDGRHHETTLIQLLGALNCCEEGESPWVSMSGDSEWDGLRSTLILRATRSRS